MKALSALTGFVGVVSLIFLDSIFGGYVLSKVWGWFIVPTFGAPGLSIVPAIGMALVVGYLTHQRPNNDDKSLGEVLYKSFAFSFALTGIVLLLGWILHMFM